MYPEKRDLAPASVLVGRYEVLNSNRNAPQALPNGIWSHSQGENGHFRASHAYNLGSQVAEAEGL